MNMSLAQTPSGVLTFTLASASTGHLWGLARTVLPQRAWLTGTATGPTVLSMAIHPSM